MSDLADSQNIQPVAISPLDRAYEAKVLAHFPKKRDEFSFAYEVSSVENIF